jgi:ligand-binding SRPBCC domain-containing protein
MKVYKLRRQQFLPVDIEVAWEFFSSPGNLARITPARMKFKILKNSGDGEMFSGQIIHYKIQLLPGVTTRWVTEITHVYKPFHFIDEQRSGPYAFWRHKHSFKATNGGVEMTDDLSYAIPMGWLGRLAHAVFVRRELNTIFDYRYAVLKKYFQEVNAN